MSHTTRIDCIIKDLDALQAVLPGLGLEWCPDQTTFRIWGGNEACQHAIRVKGKPQAYEIGLIQRADGKGFDLLWDEYGSVLVNQVGQGAAKLRAAYGLEAAKRSALKQGFSVRQVVSTSGRPALELRKSLDW